MSMMVTARPMEKPTRKNPIIAYRRPTKSVERALQRAQHHAVRQGRGLAAPSDLLLALTDDPQGLPMLLIGQMGVSPQTLTAAIVESAQNAPAAAPVAAPTEEEWAASRADLLEEARYEAVSLGSSHLGTEHLLLGLLRREGAEAGLLESLGLTRERIVSTLEERSRAESASELAPASA